MQQYQVLLRPLLSEKSNNARESSNQYVFRVALEATKDDVRKAIESAYSVKVSSVRTVVTRGKVKRRGNHVHKLSNVKKAIVTLPEGTKLGLFEDL